MVKLKFSIKYLLVIFGFGSALEKFKYENSLLAYIAHDLYSRNTLAVSKDTVGSYSIHHDNPYIDTFLKDCNCCGDRNASRAA